MVEYVELIFTFITKNFKRFISYILARKTRAKVDGNKKNINKKKNKKLS